ncbi:carbamate kinase [Desulfonatronum thioautotrophicum]|uniref:carbamate kinase n=1 Tax=Desulfonatronum thioautotrophicum TaxID=617001 RepID=UPI0005EAEADD|nr:carbamate kinase [Desulfonatronum thioautotrophicum]
MSSSSLMVIAVGGNSLISAKEKVTVEDQYAAIQKTVRHVADIVETGRRVCITHGNGPQVGFILRRSEIARKVAGMHPVPLPSCVADTQGAIGWQIQQALANELQRRGLGATSRGMAVSVVTQVVVDADDPAFITPDKFVGEVFQEADLPTLYADYPHWVLKMDRGRGWRRVVPSPGPLEIVELPVIRSLLEQGYAVVAVGGGGVPVVRGEDGELRGVSAVVDKDLATGLLAAKLDADLLVISTAVRQVSLDYGEPGQRGLGQVTTAELQAYQAQGHFPPGSMGPKITAALDFLAQGGRKVIITSPDNLIPALEQGAGTHIT